MKAGRELDALVAEKIFGWTRFVIEYAPGIKRDVWQSHDNHQYQDDRALPEFSTDIAAAWQVVEEIKRIIKFRRFELVLSPITWSAEFIIDNESFYDSSGASPSHAICLAALKAVGVEV